MSKHGCDECGKWHDGRVGCEMTDQPLSSTLEDSRFNRFDDELIDTYFNEAGKQAIRDYIANQVEANTPTSTDDERDKETAARIREINLLLIDGKCTPEYAYERIEEIVREQLNADQPQTELENIEKAALDMYLEQLGNSYETCMAVAITSYNLCIENGVSRALAHNISQEYVKITFNKGE